MWDETYSIFQDELGSNERILWSGRPKTGLVFRSSDIFLIPFSLMWGGFAVFWEIGVISSGAPFFFWIWGIPFVLAGLYFILGRFFVDAQQRANTYYALTNERVIIISGLFNRNIKSLNLKTLSEINIDSKRDGTGTVNFGRTDPRGWMYSGNWWPSSGKYIPPRFEMVKNAKEVYDKIRDLQRNA